jgi:hypothetical protein
METGSNTASLKGGEPTVVPSNTHVQCLNADPASQRAFDTTESKAARNASVLTSVMPG